MVHEANAAEPIETEPGARKITKLPSQQETEDVRFLRFASEYMALLATVAAIPLVSTALGVLPMPVRLQVGEGRLSVLAAFLCLIVFAATYLLRGALARLALSKYTLLTIIPFFVAAALIFGGLLLVSQYMGLLAATEGGESLSSPDQARGLVRHYLAIFPVFVLALGLVLVTAFSTQTDRNIQSLVSSQLRDRANEIYNMLRHYAEFRALARKGEPLRIVGETLLQPFRAQLTNLAEGRIEVSGILTARIQGLLMSHLKVRFDAVSDRDLDFWLGQGGDPVAAEYFQRNLEAIDRGTAVTRIFLFGDNDLFGDKQSEPRLNDIVFVLSQQESAGIGWAVAVYEELSPDVVENPDAALDFALFDKDKAVSYFRDYRERKRRFTARFATTGNRDVIVAQRRQYEALLSQCWLINGAFRQQSEESIRRMRPQIDLYGRNLWTRLVSDEEWRPPVPEAPFILGVSEIAEIGAKVQMIADLRLRSKKWHVRVPEVGKAPGNQESS